MKKLILPILLLLFLLPALAQRPALAPPVVRFSDSNGVPLAGGFLYSYQAGTTTPLATYSDSTSTTVNQNPVQLDSTGSATVFLGASTYKLVLENSVGVVQWTQDNIGQPTFSACSFTSVSGLYALHCGPAGTDITTPVAIGNPITSPSVNNDIYLNTSSEVGAQITAAATALAATGGRIVLPVGTMTMTTTATITSPSVSLVGRGSLASKINCSVAGNCLLIDYSSSTSHGQIYGAGAEFSGFALVGNGAATQSIIHARDMGGVNMHDLDLDGASESGGSCLELEDYNYWTERNRINHVNFRYACYISMLFYANSTQETSFCPTSNTNLLCSFGYNDIQVSMNPGPGQFGFAFEGQGVLYNGTLIATQNLSGNCVGTPPSCTSGESAVGMYASGYFTVIREWLNLRNEENGTGDVAWNLTSANNNFLFGGHAYLDSSTVNISSTGAQLAITEGGWGADYTQGTYTSQQGIPYDLSAGGNTFLIPVYASSGSYTGVGLHGRFQYSSGSFLCLGDGGNNGCAFMLTNDATGATTFYNVPRTGGGNQTISPGSLSTYLTMTISPTGQVTYPSLSVTKSIANGAGLQLATGTMCSLSGSIGASCSVSMIIPITEPDTSYRVSGCMVNNAGANVVASNPTAFNVAGFSLIVSNMSTTATSTGTPTCIITH